MSLAVKADFVKLVDNGLRLDLLDVVRLLTKLVLYLLDLVLQNLQLTLLVLELVSVNVNFALEAGCFTLVDGVVATTHRRAPRN